MNFQGMQSSNFAQAGKAAADATVRAHAAARRNSPKYDKIIKSADNFRAAKEQAALKLQADVVKTGIDAAGQIEGHRITKTAERGLAQSKRKAGVLAAGGKLLAGAGDAFKEAPKYESTSLDYSEQIAKLRAKAKGYYDSVGDGTVDLTDTSTTTTPSPSSSSTSSSTSTTKPDSPATPKGSDGKPISSFQKSGKKGSLTVSDMTKYALQAGFSPEQAKIMGAIGMAESGGNPKIDTVQSGLDPNKSNEFSIGAFQVNVQAHRDKLNKLGYTEDDLRDPVKAATVAKMVYDEVGSFKPWSVYKSGAYTQYLQ